MRSVRTATSTAVSKDGDDQRAVNREWNMSSGKTFNRVGASNEWRNATTAGTVEPLRRYGDESAMVSNRPRNKPNSVDGGRRRSASAPTPVLRKPMSDTKPVTGRPLTSGELSGNSVAKLISCDGDSVPSTAGEHIAPIEFTNLGVSTSYSVPGDSENRSLAAASIFVLLSNVYGTIHKNIRLFTFLFHILYLHSQKTAIYNA